eukprot:SAG31_NODE_7846_length_1583_cov_3.441375_1_plen_43_part_10
MRVACKFIPRVPTTSDTAVRVCNGNKQVLKIVMFIRHYFTVEW